ncbi:uncharacterized protein LOC120638649 [Ornithorhynchus anatinus]|uniref:uncharacterized protein LOC120638649 n=1 Tax=Ornithorhynchus anatinus TaxID=9258 RepID=UPI0019D45697|nr:uncharacterized protein LOC120638649 [Ornithorhynchus anatinus]
MVEWIVEYLLALAVTLEHIIKISPIGYPPTQTIAIIQDCNGRRVAGAARRCSRSCAAWSAAGITGPAEKEPPRHQPAGDTLRSCSGASAREGGPDPARPERLRQEGALTAAPAGLDTMGRRLPGPGLPPRPFFALLHLPLLLRPTLLSAVPNGDPGQSCEQVRKLFQLRQLGWSGGPPEAPRAGPDLQVCSSKGPTCCTKKMEERYQLAAQQDIQQVLQTTSSTLKFLISRNAATFQGAYSELLGGSGNPYVQMKTNSPHFSGETYHLFLDSVSYLEISETSGLFFSPIHWNFSC